MNDKIEYWIEMSEYDFDSAKALLKTKRFLHAGFMCHQTIEKILKAYWQYKKDDMPPKTHNLSYLASKTGLFDELSYDQLSLLDELDPLNIEARYPEHKDLLFKKMNKNYTKNIVKKTQELYTWIKMKL
ncbi:MAG: HEPN domain-containing protein [Spirochaetota bacterium]